MSSGLRSISLAALHDGNEFLIEQYSLGMLPSVSLTNSDYRSLQHAPVLAMGASEFQTLNPLYQIRKVKGEQESSRPPIKMGQITNLLLHRMG
ncbi:MAG: CHAT domain-containing protein [Spirulina sp. SIO3F2]|nr:CHAT domain-containing protein [Spirulina sp. SIO3F2]